jgi:Tfp pilus assembly protein PilF
MLSSLGRLEEALEAYEEAIRLNPQFVMAHSGRGAVLHRLGREEEALTAFKEAMQLRPNSGPGQVGLGNALQNLGRLEEAAAEFQEALRLNPNYAEAHYNLGLVLLRQGQFAEALASLQRGHELGTKNPSWRYPSAQWIKETERLMELDAKLPAVLKGELLPADATERTQMAELCQRQHRRLYLAAVRLYVDGFAADPKLAEDLRRSRRYNAACAAALASGGQGKDTDKLSDDEKAGLRQQALEWLKADLALLSVQSKSDKLQEKAQPQQKLRHWLQDADLAGVRADALVSLPNAEAAAWKKLWADLDAVLKQVESKN